MEESMVVKPEDEVRCSEVLPLWPGGPLSSESGMNLIQLETDVRDLCPNLPMMYNVGMAMSC